MDSFEHESPIFLGGDFNAGNIDWDTNIVTPSDDRKTFNEELIEILNTHTWSNCSGSPLEVKQSCICIHKPTEPGKCTTTAPGISGHHIRIQKDIQRTPLFHDLTLNNG